MFLLNFLGINKLSSSTKRFLYKHIFLSITSAFILNLTSTFYLLYIIDSIGFLLTGTIAALLLFVQFIFDYPSGSLADKIGHRWVYSLSMLSFGIALLILILFDDYYGFVLFAIFQGFGSAQLSGVLESWTDNNYKALTEHEDKDRKIYGFYTGRMNTVSISFMAISFMIGGYIATSISRKLVFEIQIILMTILIAITIKLMTNDEKFIAQESKQEKENYFSYFKGGIKFLFSSKKAFFFLLGIALYTVPWMIWGYLVLFPLYFGYSGTDTTTALLRTIIFINGILLQIFVITPLSKKLSNSKQPYLLLFNSLLYFTGLILLLLFNPITNEFNIIGFVGVIILQNGVMNMFLVVEQILRNRIMLDFVPSQYRNAVYSLVPTIYSIISVPVIIITGSLIDSYGLVAGIFVAQIFALLGAISVIISHKFGLTKTIDYKTQPDLSKAVAN